ASGATASLSVPFLTKASRTINHTGTVVVTQGTARVSDVSQLTIQPGGSLDLTNSGIILNDTAANLTARVQQLAGSMRPSGYQGWDGGGSIYSSVVRADGTGGNAGGAAI